jgi:FkbM family methyltransferase
LKTELARLANRLYDTSPAVHRALYGAYKRWSDRIERALIRSLLRPGMHVLDVGANIGIYTEFLASLVGQEGRVFAFEPESRNVERLRKATRNLPQVTVVPAGVAERSGTLELFVTDDFNADHRTYAAEPGRRSVEIRAVALDDHVPPGQKIHFIKMDIQGAELAALRGARQLLSGSDAPTLLFEYWPHGLRAAGHDPRMLIEELKSFGYDLSTIAAVPWPDPGSDDPNDYINVFATPPRRPSPVPGR